MEQISLMYHDIYETFTTESGFQTRGAEKYKVPLKQFIKQIEAISEYCKLKNISKNRILLTFDDGGSSSYSSIAPILKKYEFKGYFFITTAFIDTKGFLTKEEIISLHKDGHFLGTHSHTHPGLLNSIPFKELEEEWSFSMKILENILQTKIYYASIPGGSYSQIMNDILIANGIKYIFTSKPTTKIQYINDGCEIIGRFAILNTTNVAEVMDLLKPFSWIRYKQTIKWNLLSLLKSTFGINYLLIRKRFLK